MIDCFFLNQSGGFIVMILTCFAQSKKKKIAFNLPFLGSFCFSQVFWENVTTIISQMGMFPTCFSVVSLLIRKGAYIFQLLEESGKCHCRLWLLFSQSSKFFSNVLGVLLTRSVCCESYSFVYFLQLTTNHAIGKLMFRIFCIWQASLVVWLLIIFCDTRRWCVLWCYFRRDHRLKSLLATV